MRVFAILGHLLGETDLRYNNTKKLLSQNLIQRLKEYDTQSITEEDFSLMKIHLSELDSTLE